MCFKKFSQSVSLQDNFWNREMKQGVAIFCIVLICLSSPVKLADAVDAGEQCRNSFLLQNKCQLDCIWACELWTWIKICTQRKSLTDEGTLPSYVGADTLNYLEPLSESHPVTACKPMRNGTHVITCVKQASKFPYREDKPSKICIF